jgi:hypothetical protein
MNAVNAKHVCPSGVAIAIIKKACLDFVGVITNKCDGLRYVLRRVVDNANMGAQ